VKEFFVILMIISAASPFSRGQSIRQKMSNTGQRQREVRRVEGQWRDALLRRDLKALEKILADEYVSINSKGEIQNKTQELAGLKADVPRFVSFDTDEVEVHVYGDAAITTGRESLSVLYENQEVSGQFRYTRVYVRRQRRWVLAASHTSKEQSKEAPDEGTIP
jgi:ketosteroid isomerase-like protein